MSPREIYLIKTAGADRPSDLPIKEKQRANPPARGTVAHSTTELVTKDWPQIYHWKYDRASALPERGG